MKKLVKDDKVLAVLGPTFSNSAAEADPVANKAKTPVLAVSNTGPGIVGDCPYPCEYVFRNSLGEAEAIPANIGEYVKRINPDNAAIIHAGDDPFGASSAATAKKAFAAEKKVKVVQDTTYPAACFQGRDLSRSPYAVMVTASSGETVVKIIKALRRQGFANQILGGNAFNSTTTSANLASVGIRRPERGRLVRRQRVGREHDLHRGTTNDEYGEAPPDQFAAQAYTGVELLAQASTGRGPRPRSR